MHFHPKLLCFSVKTCVFKPNDSEILQMQNKLMNCFAALRDSEQRHKVVQEQQAVRMKTHEKQQVSGQVSHSLVQAALPENAVKRRDGIYAVAGAKSLRTGCNRANRASLSSYSLRICRMSNFRKRSFGLVITLNH